MRDFPPETHSPNDSWWWWWGGSINPPRAIDKMRVYVSIFWPRVNSFHRILRHSGFPQRGGNPRKRIFLLCLCAEESVWSRNPIQVHWGRSEGKLTLRAANSPCVLGEARCLTNSKNWWRKNSSVFGEESLDGQGARSPSLHPSLTIVYPSDHPPIIHSSIRIVTEHLPYPRSQRSRLPEQAGQPG